MPLQLALDRLQCTTCPVPLSLKLYIDVGILPIFACSCLLEELLQTYGHEKTKDSQLQTRVITLDSRLRSRILWAAAMLEQTV